MTRMRFRAEKRGNFSEYHGSHCGVVIDDYNCNCGFVVYVLRRARRIVRMRRRTATCKERSTRDPDQQHTEDQGPCIWSIEAGADSNTCAVLRHVDTMRHTNVSNARFASRLL